MRQENVHFLYIGAFVDELARAGMRNVCFAPGSRSTPLAVMLAAHPGIRLWMHLDERSASFFALGMAKASRRPVGLLCSSGTAAANFYPAVIEARYSCIPLVVMTADRPPELQDIGAPQTIDQNRLYGEHAKWFANLALPDANEEMLRYARAIAGRAVTTALEMPCGPIHLNFPFREPLMPLPPHAEFDVDPLDAAGERLVRSRDERGQAPPQPTSGTQGRRQPDGDLTSSMANRLTATRRGLIVCGPQYDPELGPAAVELGRTLGYPLLADPLSLVRNGPHHNETIIDSYDAFLKDDSMVETLAPEVIIRFGAMPTSKPYLLYSQRYPDAWHVLVDGGDGWNDPALLANVVIHADPVRFCEALVSAVRHSEYRSDREWLSDWVAIDRTTRETLVDEIDEYDEMFEGRVFQELACLLPDGSALYAGNSMPVRDMDTFFRGGPRAINFLSNRGANGIDGVVSSALGASVASDRPLVLVIGDISFYHDMNGLLAAKLHELDATIILVNNDGGGIFSFLPQARHPEQFEALFGTPHGLNFKPAAELYGLDYQRVHTWDEFRVSVEASLDANGVQIVEVPAPDRTRNVELHRALWAKMSARLNELDLGCRVTP